MKPHPPPNPIPARLPPHPGPAEDPQSRLRRAGISLRGVSFTTPVRLRTSASRSPITTGPGLFWGPQSPARGNPLAPLPPSTSHPAAGVLQEAARTAPLTASHPTAGWEAATQRGKGPEVPPQRTSARPGRRLGATQWLGENCLEGIGDRSGSAGRKLWDRREWELGVHSSPAALVPTPSFLLASCCRISEDRPPVSLAHDQLPCQVLPYPLVS